jgi:hypothetical protein
VLATATQLQDASRVRFKRTNLYPETWLASHVHETLFAPRQISREISAFIQIKVFAHRARKAFLSTQQV